LSDIDSNHDVQILLLTNPKTSLHFQIIVAKCVTVLGNILVHHTLSN